jgi:hypothetical protein
MTALETPISTGRLSSIVTKNKEGEYITTEK